MRSINDSGLKRIAGTLKKSQVFGGEALSGDEVDADKFAGERRDYTPEELTKVAEDFLGEDLARFVDHAEGGYGEEVSWHFEATITIPFHRVNDFWAAEDTDGSDALTEEDLEHFSNRWERGPGRPFGSTYAYGLKKTTRGYTFKFSASGGLDI